MELSLNQALTTSYPDFAPSWQAGVSRSQCTPKSLKNIDVESVNIVKTCEKLTLVLNENLELMRSSAQSVNNIETQCAIRKSDVSFRDFSNIWFGTLKIYQQQVNTLFRLSQDLYTRSGSDNYKVKSLAGRKRNSSLSQKLAKKRCLTLNDTYNEETLLTTNYSKLLDELEDLAQDSTSKSSPENPGSVTQYQIRKITIQEINTIPFNYPDELEEDSGFGEATSEEIAEFLNFSEDNEISKMNKTTVKRKLTNVEDSPIKKTCHSADFFAEPSNDDVLITSTLKRTDSPTHSVDKSYINIKNCLPDNVKYNNIFDDDKVKKENLADVENTATVYLKKKRFPIIDYCTKIDISDVNKAMKNSDILTKHPRKPFLKLYNKTRNITACELLNRFNRRSLKLPMPLKQKPLLSREQFVRDYLNLIREIVKPYYKEDCASEIYPNWIYFGDEQVKQNKKQRLNKSNIHKTIVIQPDADVFNFNGELVSNLAANSTEEMPALNVNEKVDHWRPCGVMRKLLNLWRANEAYTISSYELFKLAESQIDRGLGFSSLLHLSKKRFVNLEKFPESIELQSIVVGKNIERYYVNNIG